MENITQEYFENQLDSLYDSEEDIKRTILKQYMYDEHKDIYISPNPMLDDSDEINCLKKMHLNRNGFDIYLYVVKVDRSHLSKKPTT